MNDTLFSNFKLALNSLITESRKARFYNGIKEIKVSPELFDWIHSHVKQQLSKEEPRSLHFIEDEARIVMLGVQIVPDFEKKTLKEDYVTSVHAEKSNERKCKKY